MKFMWQSNAPWAGTGYGTQSKLVLKGLLDRGHEPRMFAFYGLAGGIIEYDGYPVYPNSDAETWGNDVIKAHIERSKSEAVVSLIDIWVLNPDNWGRLPVPWAGWVPIDCIGMGRETSERLKLIDYPVAMSQFGAAEMLKVGVEPTAMIYHAVDTDVFTPMDKGECREQFGIGKDEYIIGMVMANKGDRKQYPTQFLAIRAWMEEHPELNVKVFIHTEPTASLGGWDMKALTAKTGLTGKVYSTNRYDTSVVPLPQEDMAKVFNCFDVLLNCSSGEGFGIPIAEAQACGVPVITHNVTAMPELTHNGYAVESGAQGLGGHYGWQFIPSVDDIQYRLESVYRMCDSGTAARGRAWVEENCQVDKVVDMWSMVLNKIEMDQEQGEVAIEIRETEHPKGPTTPVIEEAREAMMAEFVHYGNYSMRMPEYELMTGALVEMGLRDGDRILDVGAAFGDFGRYLQTTKQWHGVYTPVDMIIDGTDLRTFEFPPGYNFIVLEQVIEHVENWEEVLDRAEAMAGGLLIATPNAHEHPEDDKHDLHSQMAHVALLTPEVFEARGYKVSTYSLTGHPNDTIVASKVCNTVKETDGVHGDRTAEAVSS